jgi:pilus assembly protein CpaE
VDIYWQLPNDYRVMVDVRNNGVPLMEHAPKAAITQTIGALAQALSGKVSDDDDDGESRTGRRWLNLWGAKAKS